MNSILQGFLNPGFVYRFEMGPGQVPDKDTAFRSGVNCVSLAHLVLKELFGQKLPGGLDCFEMFTDRERFAPVSLGQAQMGDLVWFGRSCAEPIDGFVPKYDQDGSLVNWQQYPLEHVAIATGSRDDAGDLQLLHATHFEGTTAVWPLTKFSEYARYAEVLGISRLRPQLMPE